MGRMKRIDLGFGTLTKTELLNQLKQHLDEEFPTDVVTDSIITITNEGQGIAPPHPPPPGGKAK